MKEILICLLLCTGCASIQSQKAKVAPTPEKETKDAKWDVNTPAIPFKEVTITTDEGTWMSVDVSPDGKLLVFDMLGDIYTLPVTGGKATLIRGGHAFEVQPRFSPNGNRISFTSDASGGDNIWTMKVDGTDAKQVTKEDFNLTNNAVWSADGQYIICRKHFTSSRSLGAGELWMYHITGGKGVQLTKRKNDQQDAGEPWASADGKSIYFSEDMYPGGSFQYNKDPNSQIYAIRKYDVAKGKVETVTGGTGGAIRPVLSHDGKTLAFVRRVRTKSVLYLRDIDSGREWPIYDKLDKDQQEAWAIFGPYMGFNWTPDDQHIIVSVGGKIQKIAIAEGTSENIPFEAVATHKIADALRFKNDAFNPTVTVKTVRQTVTSPDGKYIVFNAVGYLWKKNLPDGKPGRLTSGVDLEFEPSFSADGSHLLYVTWNDEEMGAIYELNMGIEGATPHKLTTEKGIYREPAYSPLDENMIVFTKEGGNTNQGFTNTLIPGIYTMEKNKFIEGIPVTKKVADSGSNAVFSSDGTRIIYQAGGYLFDAITKSLKSVDLNGFDQKDLVNSKYGQRLVLSPDNKWVAFSHLYKVYVAPIPPTGTTIELEGSTTAIPISQFAPDAGISIHWSSDSKKLNWTLGERYFNQALDKRFLFLSDTLQKAAPMDSIGLAIGLELPADKPTGIVAFTNARIITMEGDQVIEVGNLVVDGNTILAVGPAATTPVPANAKVIESTGKTIMPGLVDVHAHLGQFRFGLSAQKHWQYYANLAFGVTTTHDPSANTEMVFSQSEMVKTGNMVGPRIFSTGIILYGADGDFKAVVNSLEDARSSIRRTKAYGAFSVKSYNQPRRDQRQQVIKAAFDEKMLVVPEGGSTFFHNLSMILDGHTGIEHNLPITPMYKDVIKLWSASKTGYTPTLIVNYGGLSGENYWYQTTNVWENERLLEFTPRSVVDTRSRHRTMAPIEEYENGHILTSETCKVLSDAGVGVNLGAHGQLQGLGAHWELWMLHQGGMSEMEALRSATMTGAKYIGMDHQIGSLVKGKLADLIVLDKNPLDDIQNSESVIYTMVNGRLYDAATMNEVGNHPNIRTKFYWEKDSYAPDFDWHGHTTPGCSCGVGH